MNKIKDTELKELSLIKKLRHAMLFIAISFPFILSMIMIVIYLCYLTPIQTEDTSVTFISSFVKSWQDPTDHASVLISFGTLMLLVIFWFTNMYKNWKNSLPPYVSAIFTYQDKSYFETRYYRLTGINSSDIRQLPQSVAKTYINDGEYLPFSHSLKIIKEEIVQHPEIEDEKPFRHVVIIMSFTNLNLGKINLTKYTEPPFIVNSYDPTFLKECFPDGVEVSEK